MKKRKKTFFSLSKNNEEKKKKRKSIVKVSTLNSNIKSLKNFAFVLFQVFFPKIRQMRIFDEYMAVLNCDT